MESLKKWWRHIILILVLIILPIIAIYLNGTAAWEGITWGITKTQESEKSLPVIKIHDLGVNYGVYDHDQKFTQAEGLAFEHLYYQWNDYNSETFLADLSKVIERNRWPLITIEPFPLSNDSLITGKLFHDILSGRYDIPITQLKEDIVTFNRPIFIRWGHEMEKLTGRYPWASEDYTGYIEAYRYVVDKIRETKKEVFFVWSPVGNKEMFDYWPGSNHVDYVGVSVYSYHEFESDKFGRLLTFEEIFDEKYARASVFGKSVMIAELGIAGEPIYQQKWMYEAFKSFKKYPELKSAIYFNARDSELAWDAKYAVPDWHIDSTLFDQFDFTVKY